MNLGSDLGAFLEISGKDRKTMCSIWQENVFVAYSHACPVRFSVGVDFTDRHGEMFASVVVFHLRDWQARDIVVICT